MLVWHYIDSIEIRIGGNSMIEEEKTDSDGSGPISQPIAKTPRKRAAKKVEEPIQEVVEEPVEEISVPEPEIKTNKTYSIEVHVNDPLPQANDITQDIIVGNVSYNEATDEVTTESVNPKYEAMFNHFSQISYYIETEDAPLVMTRSLGKDWALNLYKAIPNSLIVNERRGVKFFATEPQIASEEPI